jgi:hypothetical protein
MTAKNGSATATRVVKPTYALRKTRDASHSLRRLLLVLVLVRLLLVLSELAPVVSALLPVLLMQLQRLLSKPSSTAAKLGWQQTCRHTHSPDHQ